MKAKFGMKEKFDAFLAKLSDAKHRALDFYDAIQADPKKQKLAIGVAGFVVGFVFAKVFA